MHTKTTNKKGPPCGEPFSSNYGAAPGVEKLNNLLIYLILLCLYCFSISKTIHGVRVRISRQMKRSLAAFALDCRMSRTHDGACPSPADDGLGYFCCNFLERSSPFVKIKSRQQFPGRCNLGWLTPISTLLQCIFFVCHL